MFDSLDFPQSLDEDLFDSWLEIGRASKIPYAYLVIVWDELEKSIFPFSQKTEASWKDLKGMGILRFTNFSWPLMICIRSRGFFRAFTSTRNTKSQARAKALFGKVR